MPRPSAAESLFPYLPHRTDDVAKRENNTTVAAAMYPRLAEKSESGAREHNRKSILPDLVTKRGRQ